MQKSFVPKICSKHKHHFGPPFVLIFLVWKNATNKIHYRKLKSFTDRNDEIVDANSFSGEKFFILYILLVYVFYLFFFQFPQIFLNNYLAHAQGDHILGCIRNSRCCTFIHYWSFWYFNLINFNSKWREQVFAMCDVNL